MLRLLDNRPGDTPVDPITPAPPTCPPLGTARRYTQAELTALGFPPQTPRRAHVLGEGLTETELRNLGVNVPIS